MRAERLPSRLWQRGGRTHPEAALEDALAAALESTDAWPRLVRHFGWALPSTRPLVSQQDRVEAGRSDIRLGFPGEPLVVLELKAGPAPSAAQLTRYAAGARVLGVATTPRTYPTPGLLGSVTWADLLALPWTSPPLEWRQLLHLAQTLGVAVPPVDLAALSGLQASYDAFQSVQHWARECADLAARRLSTPALRWVTREGKAGRRWDERNHRRQVAWAWPLPWRAHPYAGVWTGLYFGRPDAPVQVAGLPDLVVAWQCIPGSPLHTAIAADMAMQATAARWAELRSNHTVRFWQPGGWQQLSARSSTARLLGQAEPGRTTLDWLTSVLDEWAPPGGLAKLLQARLLSAPAAAAVSEDGPPEPTPFDASSPAEQT